MFDTPQGRINRILVTAQGVGLVDFALIPHLDHATLLPGRVFGQCTKSGPRESPRPPTRSDDETAIKVVDGTVEVVSRGTGVCSANRDRLRVDQPPVAFCDDFDGAVRNSDRGLVVDRVARHRLCRRPTSLRRPWCSPAVPGGPVRENREVNQSQRFIAAGGGFHRRSPRRFVGSSRCSRRSGPRRPSRRSERQEGRPARTAHPVAQVQWVAAVDQQDVVSSTSGTQPSLSMLGSARELQVSMDFQPSSTMGLWALVPR